MTNSVRPRCFLDIHHGMSPVGRVVIELFTDKTPKTCENFRSLCTGSNPSNLHYKSSIFHRVIEDFMIQGGDITSGDGKGGLSIYGETFEDENLGWSDIDREGLVCMANRGKDTNSSQFFITCAPCDHLNGKHTVFGHVVAGLEFIKEIEGVKVDSSDKPVVDVFISNCGELEFRRAPAKASKPADTRASRDRKRSRSRSASRTRSRDRDGIASRDKDRDASRTRSPRGARSDRHRRRRGDRDRDRDSNKDSRRSHRRHDHHHRRNSRSRSPRQEDDLVSKEPAVSLDDTRPTSRSKSPEKIASPKEQRNSRSSRHHRPSRRSYSRSRSRSRDPHRNPRGYDNEEDFDSEEERRVQREEDERESNRRHQHQQHHDRPYRSPPRRDDRHQSGDSGVTFKGRGSMKYREKSSWNSGYNRFGRLI
ncbi:hypothetical protein H072_11184 [Dactylellina haptotyla CBS 200.50]|uniref:peptidylprolyl isomerase n=1 Tax=Dactylellina haptotyla (strain CBS 200.50) TaxID=1284197 RepID=S7ZYC8_DACHA|nr:hypothetical protein H072_11184 [Dactylellina haptotyla CBS 200.50]